MQSGHGLNFEISQSTVSIILTVIIQIEPQHLCGEGRYWAHIVNWPSCGFGITKWG